MILELFSNLNDSTLLLPQGCTLSWYKSQLSFHLTVPMLESEPSAQHSHPTYWLAKVEPSFGITVEHPKLSIALNYSIGEQLPFMIFQEGSVGPGYASVWINIGDTIWKNILAFSVGVLHLGWYKWFNSGPKMPIYKGEANKCTSSGCTHVAFLHYLLHEGKSAKGEKNNNNETHSQARTTYFGTANLITEPQTS